MSAFRSSNRSKMGSNAITDQNQGGGEKKAGFPYQVGRDSWSSIAIKTCNPQFPSFRCCSLDAVNTTKLPMANFSRPVGTPYQANYRRFNVLA